ncbi:hypothetical protein [Caballeronia sp. SL2Y3]|uniref:hypothetical protein n=1 Tax=Caballeronia sp. SL2Y3 TaxID=2878151 RepID=UPI001FD20494|nr:hypothetical protein [Caballeronia sp. SL2Y3]
MKQPSEKGRAMQPPAAESIERSMYILGQIGAIVCHERGPRPNTAILTTMASHPAEGLWLAITRMNELCPAVRGPRRTLLQWKRREIARLARMLPHPLPADACAQTQAPFWAGYCQYWEDVLKQHVDREMDAPAVAVDEVPARRVNA